MLFQEFHTYLREVKKEEPTMMSRRDEEEFYKDFCEVRKLCCWLAIELSSIWQDYNTATMPSEKCQPTCMHLWCVRGSHRYYDMRKWEVQQRAKAEKERKKMADDPNNVRTVFDDEEAKRCWSCLAAVLLSSVCQTRVCKGR